MRLLSLSETFIKPRTSLVKFGPLSVYRSPRYGYFGLGNSLILNIGRILKITWPPPTPIRKNFSRILRNPLAVGNLHRPGLVRKVPEVSHNADMSSRLREKGSDESG